VSKAFTKEDEQTGFVPPSSDMIALPKGPFRITATGARLAAAHPDPRVREALERAEKLPPVGHPERASLGVTVRVRNAGGPPKQKERIYRLVSAEERALLGEGCSVDGPIGSALLGAKVGDVREVTLPRGVEELEVVALHGES
jgi:transcription elongation GreA/GreB family factor